MPRRSTYQADTARRSGKRSGQHAPFSWRVRYSHATSSARASPHRYGWRLPGRADTCEDGPTHTEEAGQASAPEAVGTRGGPKPVVSRAGERAGARSVLSEPGVAGRPFAHRDRRRRRRGARGIGREPYDLPDYLADKLRDDRGRLVIEPMLSGSEPARLHGRRRRMRARTGDSGPRARLRWPTRSTPRCCRVNSHGSRRRRWFCHRCGT